MCEFDDFLCSEQNGFILTRNAAEPVEGRATNNAGEIQGAIHAIKDCIRERVKYLRINTDSEFLCNAVDKWLPRWERNGFCKANGEPLANKYDFMELSELLDTSSMQIEFIHVSGHSGDQYNDEADRLAREGAHQYGN